MSDDYHERAALIEHDGGMPRSWAEALARLCTAPPPADMAPERWQEIASDAARLLDQWLPGIRRADWTPADIRGLLPLLRGREVVAVGRGDVQVVCSDGLKVRIYCRPVAGAPCRWQEKDRGG